MSETAQVLIDASQFPEAVRSDLLESLRSRKINHKFHYDSVKQTQKWLALHEAYSPARKDPDCQAVYERASTKVARLLGDKPVHLVGLGCGGGQKDKTILGALLDAGSTISYAPCDVSVAMVLVARSTALEVVPETDCFPVVCDLATSKDLSALFKKQRKPRTPQERDQAIVFSFFGLLPNFEPELILPKLAELIEQNDQLLLSANLAPGADYSAGVQRILPLYDNALTRDWLMTLLLDLGVERNDGTLAFEIEEPAEKLRLKRVVAYFRFTQNRRIQVEAERFEFRAGESIRLFFSYRHTPELVSEMVKGYGLAVQEQWITKSGEEGVFLVRKRA